MRQVTVLASPTHGRQIQAHSMGLGFDIMSAMRAGSFTNKFLPGSNAGPGLNAPTLDKLDWLPTDRVLDIQGGSTTLSETITSLNHPESKGCLMIRIRSPGHIYTVEFRQASG